MEQKAPERRRLVGSSVVSIGEVLLMGCWMLAGCGCKYCRPIKGCGGSWRVPRWKWCQARSPKPCQFRQPFPSRKQRWQRLYFPSLQMEQCS